MFEPRRRDSKFDAFGAFENKALEADFLESVWLADRQALTTVAWMAAFLSVLAIFIDIFMFGLGTTQFWVAAGVRLTWISVSVVFALQVQRAEYNPIFAPLALSIEVLLVSGHLLIANLAPEFMWLQLSIMLTFLVFVWFFVPKNPALTLVSTGVILAGYFLLHFRFQSDDITSLVTSSLLLFSVLAMAFLSTKSRGVLRRQSFLKDEDMKAANASLQREVETRKVAEQKEHEARLRFESLFQASPLPLALSDHENGLVVAVNEACCELVGISADEIVGQHHTAFLDRNEAYEEVNRLVNAATGRAATELEIQRRDGTVRNCMISSVRVDTDIENEDLVLTGLYDITDRKEFEQDLIQARITAENAQRTQSEFLATMSHEIRTPLNALLGFLQVVEMEELEDGVRTNLGLARQSGEHLLRLITDILDLSRISSGRVEIEPAPVDCTQLCEEAAETFLISARQKGLMLNLDNRLPHSIYEFDELRVRQVLFNLVGNAIKFTAQGEVTITAQEVTHGETAFLSFEVRDTGIGVDEDNVAHLFEEFTQADTSVTREFGGTGLGLAISKKLTEIMGGKIGAFSNAGAGATFWFEIPVRMVPTAPTLLQQADEFSQAVNDKSEPGFSDGKRILVAEDNAMNQRVISAFLSRLNIEHDIVDNGADAIDTLRERDYALVLMDIQMPKLDGVSAIRFVRAGAAGREDVPIIALTANAMGGQKDAYLKAGATGYLSKPIVLEELSQILATHLRSAAA